MNTFGNLSYRSNRGFTLVEMLVSIAILGILMLAFTQIFGGSLRASGQINGRNELISEGQIAQQLIASRLQSAYFVYPAGTVLQFTTSGDLARNTVRSGAGYTWTVNTDPIVALIVPPRDTGTCPSSAGAGTMDACFTFYAYYPVLRGVLTNPLSPNNASAPNSDSQNDSAWILMEYKANLLDGITRDPSSPLDCTGVTTGTRSGPDYLSCPPVPETVRANGTAVQPNIRGQAARMLIDYVQPTTANPTYTMFTTCVPSNPSPNGCPAGTSANDPRWAELDLRLLQRRGSKDLTAPASNAPLSTRIYPRNWKQ